MYFEKFWLVNRLSRTAGEDDDAVTEEKKRADMILIIGLQLVQRFNLT